MAALVDAQLFDRIRLMQARFDALTNRIELGVFTIPEAERIAEIDAISVSVRSR